MPGHPPPYFQPTKFSPAGISFATSSSLTAFERKQSGRAWSWHQNDIILFDAATDRTYAAAIDVPTGDQIIAIHNAAGVHQSDITITDGVFPSDDHNAPAQAFFGGKYFIGYAGHNDDNNLYLRESTDSTPENLGSVTTINTGFPVTYAQFAEVSGTLYVSCRSGSIREEWFLYQRTGAGTWTKLANVADSTTQTYINLRSSGMNLRMIAWDHPTTSSEPYRGSIYAREFSPDDAVVVTHSLGELYDPGTGKSTRVLSVLPDGSAFAFAEFTLGALSSQTYHVLRYDGTGDYDDPANWSKEDVGTNAYTYYSASNYVPGVGFADETGDQIWVAEGASGGATTLKYGTRSGGVWSFTTKVTSDEPLARPVCDPSIQGQVFLMRIIDYTSFDNQDVDSYVFYTGDSLTETSFIDQTVAALRATPEVVEYFDDPNTPNVDWDIDLSSAVDGDTIIFTGFARANISLDATLGGTAMTEDYLDSDFPATHFSYSIPYTTGMGDNLAMTGTGSPSYQKGVVAIINKEVTFQAEGETPAFLADDVVMGASHTSNDASATHTYTPDLDLGEVLHGSSVRINLAAGIASSAGTGGIVLAGSGLQNTTKKLAVYR